MTTRFFSGTLASLLLVAAAPSQQFSHDIPLSGLGNGNPARPFGIAYEPTTDRIFVPLAGAFGSPNAAVAVIDPTTDAVVATIATELYPEEVAFAYDAQGALQYGAVSNSTSGSLTIFDASYSVLAHVALPDPFGLSTCYPFGVAWDESSERFFVSTLDGSGDLHAVDPATLTVDVAAARSASFSSGARVLVHQGAAWTSATRYNAGFSNSDASVVRFPLPGVAAGDETLLVPETRGFFPSVQDLAALPDGDVLAGALSAGGLLHRFSGAGELERTHHLPSISGAHGLAVSADGKLLAVCDLYADRLVVFDLLNEVELASFQLNTLGIGYGQPNDAVFVGGKLYVTSQATEEVLVFDQLPDPTPLKSFAGQLTIDDTTPAPGATVTATVSGSGLVGIATAREGAGASFRGLTLDIGPQTVLRGLGTGTASASMSVPLRADVRGAHLWVQGAVSLDGVAELTEPRVVIVQ